MCDPAYANIPYFSFFSINYGPICNIECAVPVSLSELFFFHLLIIFLA